MKLFNVKILTFILALILINMCIISCDEADPQGKDSIRKARFDVYFTTPGTDQKNGVNAEIDIELADLFDSAQSTIELAFMGFHRQTIVDAVVRAQKRGIKIRFVGDASYGERGELGYEALNALDVPMSVGNAAHIMHNKFAVVDGRFVFFSTANITNTGLTMSYNNCLIVESIPLAKFFQAEFDQCFSGLFGGAKNEDFNKKWLEKEVGFYTHNFIIRNTQFGDVELAAYFAPHMNCIGTMLDIIYDATSSIYFTIFAFTKDEIGGAFAAKRNEGLTVKGVLDKSQVYGNGPFHEVYRLCANGMDIRMDGNENNKFPGDFQGGGGRLHSKTMLIDPDTDNATVITGSFNWSNSATRANDETLVIMKNKKIAELYKEEFDKIWNDSKEMMGSYLGKQLPDGNMLEKQDVIINEINWKGSMNGKSTMMQDECKRDSDDTHPCDEFIEIRNTSNKFIDISFWTFHTKNDIIFGLPAETHLPPGGIFLAVDHIGDAYNSANFVLNASNDYRYPRMILRNGEFYMELRDTKGNVIDQAGDGSIPFKGGLSGGKVYSMERKSSYGSGTSKNDWYSCNAENGGMLVSEEHKNNTICTPGQENSSEQ